MTTPVNKLKALSPFPKLAFSTLLIRAIPTSTRTDKMAQMI